MARMTLTVIGGGSSQWMHGLMRDVYLLDEVEGGEIRLVDPKRDAVEAVADLLKTYNRTRGKDYTIGIFEDRREALAGADFVLSTFSPGSFEAFRNDLEIPIKYGIRLPVSMTVGTGGISAAIRTAPVAYEIVSEMEEVCPDAVMLNLTNPMTVVAQAMFRAARRVRVFPMCHEVLGIGGHLEHMLGIQRPEGMSTHDYMYDYLPAQGYDCAVAGINHFVFIARLTRNGEDLLPRIRQFTRDQWDSRKDRRDYVAPWINHNAGKYAFCRTFGLLPLMGDRHLVEFWPALCNTRNGYGMKYGVEKTTVDSREANAERASRRIRRIADGLEQMDWTRSPEEMTYIMQSVLNHSRTRAILNLPNAGQIANLPDGVVVETFATVEDGRARPDAVGELPRAIAALCRLHAEVQALTLEAALTGDRDRLLQALTLDPMSGCADFSELGAMMDELLMANRKWLPRFFDDAPADA